MRGIHHPRRGISSPRSHPCSSECPSSARHLIRVLEGPLFSCTKAERAGICRRSWADTSWRPGGSSVAASQPSAAAATILPSDPVGRVVELGHSHSSFHHTLDFFFFLEYLEVL